MSLLDHITMTNAERHCLHHVLVRLGYPGLAVVALSEEPALLSCAQEIVSLDQYVYSQWVRECRRRGCSPQSKTLLCICGKCAQELTEHLEEVAVKGNDASGCAICSHIFKPREQAHYFRIPDVADFLLCHAMRVLGGGREIG